MLNGTQKHRRILYSMVYDMLEQEHFAFKNETGLAINCPQTPLWIMLAQGKTSAEARHFFREALPCFASPLVGLVAEKETAAACAEIYAQPFTHKEIRSLFLPSEVMLHALPYPLRPADASDMPVVLEWIRDFYENTLGALPPNSHPLFEKSVAKTLTVPPTPKHYSSFSVPKEKLLYVLHRDKPVAMGMLTGEGMTSRINLVYVAPDERGNGYGKMIVSGLAARARATGQVPVLYVDGCNVAAGGLYDALGFNETGRLTEISFGG